MEDDIFMIINVHTYAYMHSIPISGEKLAMNLRESGEGYMRGFHGRKGKGEIIIIL